MIYAVHILNGQFIKIGFTKHFTSKRIANMQCGNPFEIQYLFVVPGTIQQEKQIHKWLFAIFSIGGDKMPPNEWYLGHHMFFGEFLKYLRKSPESAILFLKRFMEERKMTVDERLTHRREMVFQHVPKKYIGEKLKRLDMGIENNYQWPNTGRLGKKQRRLCSDMVDFFTGTI